jgi:obg-like ATPase 1
VVAQTHFGLLNCTVTITKRTYAKSRKMPPKKAVKEEKILLGRPGNNLKAGIVRYIGR